MSSPEKPSNICWNPLKRILLPRPEFAKGSHLCRSFSRSTQRKLLSQNCQSNVALTTASVMAQGSAYIIWSPYHGAMRSSKQLSWFAGANWLGSFLFKILQYKLFGQWYQLSLDQLSSDSHGFAIGGKTLSGTFEEQYHQPWFALGWQLPAITLPFKDCWWKYLLYSRSTFGTEASILLNNFVQFEAIKPSDLVISWPNMVVWIWLLPLTTISVTLWRALTLTAAQFRFVFTSPKISGADQDRNFTLTCQRCPDTNLCLQGSEEFSVGVDCC